MALAVRGGASPVELTATLLGYCKELTALVKEPLQVPERAKTALSAAETGAKADPPEVALKKALDALFEVSPLYKDLIDSHSALKHSRDKAVKTAEKAWDLFKDGDDNMSQGAALRLAARLQVLKGRPDTAVKVANQAASIFRQAGSTKGEADTLCVCVDARVAKASLVGTEKFERQFSKIKKTAAEAEKESKELRDRLLEEAQSEARNVVALYKSIKERKGMADMYCTLSDIYTAKDDVERGKEAAQEAKEHYGDIMDAKGQQTAVQLEIEACIVGGDGNEALQVAQDAVQLFKKSRDIELEAQAHYQVMRIMFMRGDFDDLLKYSSEARDVCRRSGDVEAESLVLDCLMKTHISKEEHEKAEELARETLDLFKRADHKMGMASSMHAVAALVLEKFFKEYEDALKELKKHGYNSEYWKEPDVSRYNESINMVNEAYDIFTELGEKEARRDVEETMSTITVRGTMLNDPDETRTILRDGRLQEVINTWNINGQGEIIPDGGSKAIADEERAALEN
mmetsp:Transcript_72091/g.159526  ORF Transcript_72091/g.159526 Transcript_72091/m.159526 type:complete len:516 (-) Transcript_72091:38-1585(-)